MKIHMNINLFDRLIQLYSPQRTVQSSYFEISYLLGKLEFHKLISFSLFISVVRSKTMKTLNKMAKKESSLLGIK